MLNPRKKYISGVYYLKTWYYLCNIKFMKTRKLCWKRFDYMDDLVDFFNKNPNLEFVSHAYNASNRPIAIYYDNNNK